MREITYASAVDKGYEAWLLRKVEAARASAREERGIHADKVLAEFAALREETTRIWR